MARKKDKEKAIQMRLGGKTYSEIREKLGVSKSTLSDWLYKYPLSEERMKEVRDNNPRRIENFRKTMRKKREAKLLNAYKISSEHIGRMTKRELLIAGYFLYWAEGVKTTRTTISLANTDPAMIRFFIDWLEMLGVHKNKLRARLHLYNDMDQEKEMVFWAKEIKFPKSQFRKPYIKQSKLDDVKYAKGGFGHGTCNIIFGNQEFADKVFMSIRHIRKSYGYLTPLQEIK